MHRTLLALSLSMAFAVGTIRPENTETVVQPALETEQQAHPAPTSVQEQVTTAPASAEISAQQEAKNEQPALETQKLQPVAQQPVTQQQPKNPFAFEPVEVTTQKSAVPAIVRAAGNILVAPVRAVLGLLGIKSAKRTIKKSKKRIPLPGIIGQQPDRIYWVIEALKKQDNGPLALPNRLILHGPPGNGKTTLARTIAQVTGWEFEFISGPSIVNPYLGEGAQKIKTTFAEAAEKWVKDGTRTIIFIDEVDAIGRAMTDPHQAATRLEHNAATQELWVNLDAYKYHPGIFLICATNEFSKLHHTFLDRFNQCSIEIPNPDADQRKEILRVYFRVYQISLPTDVIDTLVAKTEGFSIRALEDLARGYRVVIDQEGSESATDNLLWDLVNETKANPLHHRPTAPLLSLLSDGSWVRSALDITSLALNIHNLSNITGFSDWLRTRNEVAPVDAWREQP